MHELQHDRAILLAAAKDVLETAELYKDDYTRVPERMALVLEASRLSTRLMKVQKQIEDLDLD